VRVEKIKVGRQTGLGDLKNSLMDTDLALFNETGVAIFSSKEAAERCMKFGGGDIEKYVQYLTNKSSDKDEKHQFVDSLKAAALVGAGAAIPKLVETAIHAMSAKPVEVATVGIMKAMLPPMTTMATSFLGEAAGIGAASAASGFISGAAAFIGAAVPIIGAISIATMVYKLFEKEPIVENFVAGIKNFFGSVWNGVKNMSGAGEGAGFVDVVKSIFTKIWNFIKVAAKKVWEVLKNAWVWVAEALTSFYKNLEGETFIDKAKSLGSKIWSGAKVLATKAWDVTKSVGSTIWGGITGVWTWGSGLFA
jgi:hypothetical protein